MADYYNGNNKVENELVKVSDKVNEWWEDLSWNDRLNIYLDFNKIDILTEEDKKDIKGDMEAHRKMEEGNE